MSASADDGEVRTPPVRDGIGQIVVDRVAKRNAFTPKMLRELAEAMTRLDADPDVRVMLLHAQGAHFTGGLDLGRMSDSGAMGEPLFPVDLVDPIGVFGRARVKPLVMAAEGVCYTLGVELMLAADIGVAGAGARFAMLEVQRSILPYGGATLRMPQRFGWGAAMRYLLTGDEFDAQTAWRLGLAQELAPAGGALDAALAIAQRIAAAAPLAAQAILASARLAAEAGFDSAAAALMPAVRAVAASEDAAEGVAAFREKRTPKYRGC